MILLGLSLFCLIVWIWLAGFRFRAHEPPPRLPALPPPKDPPGVVAVIPARDEAATIGAVIAAHTSADYAGAFTIIVVDDNSSDATAENAARTTLAEGFIGNDAGRSFKRLSDGRRVEIITAPPLEPGWSGKLWAVQNGLDHAAAIEPDAPYVLLTDADIVLAQPTLSALVAQAETNDLALASLMARLDARGFWGGLLVPAFVYFFQKLYPFHAANDPARNIAAAAGGCMLVYRRALDAIDGVKKIRADLIDDCALARALKNDNGKLWIGLAQDEAVSLRDNRTLASVWNMVARTAFTQLRHSWPLLIASVAGMALIYLVAPSIALATPWHGNAGAGAVAAAAWSVMAFSYAPTARIYEQAAWKTFALPVAAFFYSAMTISSGLRHLCGRGGQWKGRAYSARSLSE